MIRTKEYKPTKGVRQIDQEVEEWCSQRPGYPCVVCSRKTACKRTFECKRWNDWARHEWKLITGHE